MFYFNGESLKVCNKINKNLTRLMINPDNYTLYDSDAISIFTEERFWHVAYISKNYFEWPQEPGDIKT